MPAKLVSIVVPCYNTESYLAAAIESALRQTHPRVEVIVVDDGSTDGSGRIVEAFGERIVAVRQANRGLSAARNAGIAAARGEYVLLLDADDMLAPGCAASRARVLDADPGIGLVAGYYREIDARGAMLSRIPELRRVGSLAAFRQAVRRNWGPPVGWTFRREAFERCGGFDPLLRSCEDWDFAVRVATRYRIAYVPTVEAYYRRVDGSMSRNYAVMLQELGKLQLKNRAYASDRLRYWIDCRFADFQLGRRVLFESLMLGPDDGRLARTLRLMAQHPWLLWVGAMSAVSLVTGKRPSAAPPPAAEMATVG